jgi:SET domain-containing protein 6
MLGPQRWKNYGLDKGWVGLILCMMWEEAQGASSKWSQYMCTSTLQALHAIWKMVTDMMVGEVADLPMTFDTPMFWSASELEELKGTSVVGLSVPVNIK